MSSSDFKHVLSVAVSPQPAVEEDRRETVEQEFDATKEGTMLFIVSL